MSPFRQMIGWQIVMLCRSHDLYKLICLQLHRFGRICSRFRQMGNRCAHFSSSIYKSIEIGCDCVNHFLGTNTHTRKHIYSVVQFHEAMCMFGISKSLPSNRNWCEIVPQAKHRLFASGRNSRRRRRRRTLTQLNCLIYFDCVPHSYPSPSPLLSFAFRGKFKFASARRSFVDTSVFYNARDLLTI